MSLLFIDGFDHYTTLSQKYETVSGSPTISATGARNGNGLRTTSNSHGVRKTLGVNAGTLYMGAAINIASLPPSTGQGLMVVYDSGTAQASLTVKSTGQLEVNRGLITAQLANSGANLLTTDTSYYIEFMITVHATAGRFEVRVNGVTWIVDGGGTIDTNTTANAYANQAQLNNGSGATGYTVSYDDFYVCDDQGSANNTFLGDVKVTTLYPDGAGDSTQFAPSTGSNWQNVDETPPNDDTDYNSDATTGHKDLYTLTDLASTAGTVKGIQVMARTRKDDAGSRSLKSKIKSGSTEGNGATIALGSSYVYQRDVFETNPATSAAFTTTEVNSLQAGIEVVS